MDVVHGRGLAVVVPTWVRRVLSSEQPSLLTQADLSSIDDDIDAWPKRTSRQGPADSIGTSVAQSVTTSTTRRSGVSFGRRRLAFTAIEEFPVRDTLI